MKKIYLSQKLGQSGDALRQALNSCCVAWDSLPGTRDIWVRDFMPVRNGAGEWVAFSYDPSYLRDCPHRRTVVAETMEHRLALEIRYVPLRLDGGNVIFSPSRQQAVVSERVFSENPGLTTGQVIHQLEEALAAEAIFIPDLPEDLTGHADGMVRFLDDHTALGNKSVGDGALEAEIRRILAGHGIEVLDFPYYETDRINAEGVRSAEGSYLNYLETEHHLFLPVFRTAAKDAEAIRAAEGIFGKKVVPVDCRRIARMGGGLHCVTWEADDALRSDWVRHREYGVIHCPVCGRRTLSTWWICPRCGWEAEENLMMEETSDANGGLSAAQYRRAWTAAGSPVADPEDLHDPGWRELDGAVYFRREDVEYQL